MKATSLFTAILVSLSPLASAADEVKISTSVLTLPEGVNLPGQVRTITMSEWQEILQSASKHVFTAPSATTSSGKTNVSVGVGPGSYWSRHKALPPVSRIEYTAMGKTRGGIELVGDFKLNRGSASDKTQGTVTSTKVHGVVPPGKVLTFQLGDHFYGVEVSKVEEEN